MELSVMNTSESVQNVKTANIMLSPVVAQATRIRVANMRNQVHHETNRL